MEATSAGPATPAELVRQFVSRINAHDRGGLISLMSPTHAFVDSLGNRLPDAAAGDAWKQYFAMVPDYWINLEQILR